jgi:hypothetical protein
VPENSISNDKSGNQQEYSFHKLKFEDENNETLRVYGAAI